MSGLVASTFTIAVPQELLDQKSSLIVYMSGPTGPCVGQCQLDNTLKDRKILQNELKLTTLQTAASFDTVIDLMTQKEASGQDIVVLHFEFDNTIKVLQMLVVKNSFLEENPFDVLTLSVQETEEFDQNHHRFEEFSEELDDLAALVRNVDCVAMDASIKKDNKHNSLMNQYMLYAEIYMLMQYGRVKRAMHNMSSWFLQAKSIEQHG